MYFYLAFVVHFIAAPNSYQTNRVSYMLEVAKCAPQQAIRNIGKAYVNHWRDPNGMRV